MKSRSSSCLKCEPSSPRCRRRPAREFLRSVAKFELRTQIASRPLGSRQWPLWKPLHGLTFALLHLACMQMLSVVVPPALAGDSSEDLWRARRRYDDRHHDIGVRPTLRRSRPARVLGHGAALCGCVADSVRDARDLDQCIRAEFDRIVDGCYPKKASFRPTDRLIGPALCVMRRRAAFKD